MSNSKMKIFTHVLIRFGGISFDVLKQLEFSEKLLNSLAELDDLEFELMNCKEDLLQDLKTYSVDFPHFKFIRKVKKYVRKTNLVSTATFKVLDESITDKILIYNDLINKLNQIKSEVTINFDIEYTEIQKRLQILSKAENLQKALSLSSLVFAKQYLKYLEKSPTNFRKKEQQTQQATLQYLTRTAAKTSPFSSFTPIAYGKLEPIENDKYFDTSNLNTKLNRQLEWNNYLLELFKTAFQQHSAILPFLKIDINPTLKSKAEQYHFLVNQQNIERFQVLEKQEILAVFETILLTKKDLSIRHLVDELSAIIEAETSDLMNFVIELIEIGFLEIQFSFHQKSSIWLDELILFAYEIPILKQTAIPFFEKMKTQIRQFETADLVNRIQILENSFVHIQDFLASLYQGKTINLKSVISAEQLIYEDTIYQGSVKINQAKTTSLITELNELLANLNFVKGKERLEIEYFFNENYQSNEVVPLLEFYENYAKNGKFQAEKEAIESIITEGKLINNWVKSVEELLIKKYQKTGKINLETTDFQSINQQLNIRTIPLKNTAFACFAQPFEEDENWKAVLNSVSLGFGKMQGRFLDLVPNEFYEDLRFFNRDKTDSFIKVENKDAAFFNANTHENLLDFEFVTKQQKTENTKNQQVRLSDLVIKKVNHQIIIWHQNLKKQVHFYDLGIQTTKGRSPLYQFLLNFSPIVPTFYYLELAFERFQKSLNLENAFSPTIFYENWILKRASWKILNLGKLPSNKDNTLLQTYQNWQKWKAKNQLICKNYYIKNILNLNNQKLKKKKPIYTNFNNIMCLNAYFYQNDKTRKTLQIEEMKPNETELLKFSNQQFVSEFVFQWYNE